MKKVFQLSWYSHHPYLLLMMGIGLLLIFFFNPYFFSEEEEIEDAKIELTTDEIKWLQDNKILYASIKPGWAPFSFMSEHGEFRGISIDYLNRVEKMLNIKFNRLNAREDIFQENADLLIAATPPVIEKNPRYKLLDKPYIVSDFQIYTKKDRPVSNLNDLRGKE